jgi:hypothetical protein
VVIVVSTASVVLSGARTDGRADDGCGCGACVLGVDSVLDADIGSAFDPHPTSRTAVTADTRTAASTRFRAKVIIILCS